MGANKVKAEITPVTLPITVTRTNSFSVNISSNLDNINRCVLGVKKYTNQKTYDLDLEGLVEGNKVTFIRNEVELEVGQYFYDIKFYLNNSNVETYIKGTLTVKQNIT